MDNLSEKQFAAKLQKAGKSLQKKAARRKNTSFQKKTRLVKMAEYMMWISKHAWANKWLYTTLAHIPYYQKTKQILAIEFLWPILEPIIESVFFSNKNPAWKQFFFFLLCGFPFFSFHTEISGDAFWGVADLKQHIRWLIR